MDKIETNLLVEKSGVALFLFTPLCGTCKLAEKMLQVVEQLVPSVPLKKINLNYVTQFAVNWEIQSVPCLLLYKDGKISKKIYAFQSVEYLYNELNLLKNS